MTTSETGTGTQPRCKVCGWPLAADQAHGCVEGDCCYRPQGDTPEARRHYERMRAVREGRDPDAPPTVETAAGESDAETARHGAAAAGGAMGDVELRRARREIAEGFDLIDACVKVACEDDRRNGAHWSRLPGCPTYLDIRLSHIKDRTRELRKHVATMDAALPATPTGATQSIPAAGGGEISETELDDACLTIAKTVAVSARYRDAVLCALQLFLRGRAPHAGEAVGRRAGMLRASQSLLIAWENSPPLSEEMETALSAWEAYIRAEADRPTDTHDVRGTSAEREGAGRDDAGAAVGVSEAEVQEAIHHAEGCLTSGEKPDEDGFIKIGAGELTTLVAAARARRTPAAGAVTEAETPLQEACRAIGFALAIDDHYDMREFLKGWNEGDTAEWPEFARGAEEPDTLTPNPSTKAETPGGAAADGGRG